jgi:hypothetical protein
MFHRNTKRTPQETPLRSRIRHLMITLLHGTEEGLYTCYQLGTYYFGVKAKNNPISRMLESLSNDALPGHFVRSLRAFQNCAHKFRRVCSATRNIAKITQPISNNLVKPT